MRIRRAKSRDGIRLVVEGQARLVDLERLRKRLEESVPESGGTLTVDVRRVEDGGLPLAQLLVSAISTAESAGFSCSILVEPGSPLCGAVSSTALSCPLRLGEQPCSSGAG